MLDLARIRTRHEPYADTRVGQDIAALLSELDRLQAGGCARDQRTTQFCAEAAAKDAEIARLTSELAAAQAELTAARRGPVVEWRTRIDVEEATVGAFALLVESDGWRLEVSDGTGDYWIVDSGPETGDAGKAPAEAAYLKAAGLP